MQKKWKYEENMQFYMQHMQKSIYCTFCIYMHSPLYWWLATSLPHQCPPPQRLRSPCDANQGALDWRNFRANGQKENAASFFCLCCLDRAVMVLAELHVTISKFSGLELEAQVHCLPWLKHLCQVWTRSEIWNIHLSLKYTSFSVIKWIKWIKWY